MPFLTIPEEEIARAALDNYLTIGLVAVLALVVVIAVIRKAVSNKKAAAAPAVAEDAPVAEAPEAPGSAGQVKLHDVEPKTAAMIMAIVADKLGRPVNELRFKSIKEVK